MIRHSLIDRDSLSQGYLELVNRDEAIGRTLGAAQASANALMRERDENREFCERLWLIIKAMGHEHMPPPPWYVPF